jgi:hypothetical protein
VVEAHLRKYKAEKKKNA